MRKIIIGVSAAALAVALGTTGAAFGAPGSCDGSQQRLKLKDGTCQVAVDQLRARTQDKIQLKDASCQIAAVRSRKRLRDGSCSTTSSTARQRLRDGSCQA